MELRETQAKADRPQLLQPAVSHRSGGTAGNERLTAMTALVLLPLLALEGVTVLFLRPLLSVHVFVGMLLIPPVALKVASTGYRFVRYYTGRKPYRRRGVPHLVHRLLAPGLLAATVGLFASGVALIVRGPGSPLVLTLHKASFVVWIAFAGVHVLMHVLHLPRLVRADWRPSDRLRGAGMRAGLVLAVLGGGVILAVLTFPLAHSWLHWVRLDSG
jgi:hypothetical protein